MTWQVFQAYRLTTTRGRQLDVLFRGRPRHSRRLWFTNLDAPYEDIFLRPTQIKSYKKIGGQR